MGASLFGEPRRRRGVRSIPRDPAMRFNPANGREEVAGLILRDAPSGSSVPFGPRGAVSLLRPSPGCSDVRKPSPTTWAHPGGGFSFNREKREKHEKGKVDFHAVHAFHGSFIGGCTAGAESAPRESEETGTAERRRGASSRPHAERRAADGPPDRRERNLPAGGGGRILHTPEESSRGRQNLGLGLVRGGGFRRGATRRPMTARKDGRPT